jgi:hypothetical protein
MTGLHLVTLPSGHKIFHEDNEQLDLTNRASAMIRQYYLHQHFNACYAQENHDGYGDYNPACAMLKFAHGQYYLKFHETIIGDWVRETYWRINVGKEDLRDPASIVGSNVYRSSVRKSVCDLSIFRERFSEDDQDSDEEE